METDIDIEIYTYRQTDKQTDKHTHTQRCELFPVGFWETYNHAAQNSRCILLRKLLGCGILRKASLPDVLAGLEP